MDSRVRPTSREYSDADPGLLCPPAAAAAAAAAAAVAAAVAADVFFVRRVTPNVTDTYDRARRCPFVLV